METAKGELDYIVSDSGGRALWARPPSFILAVSPTVPLSAEN